MFFFFSKDVWKSDFCIVCTEKVAMTTSIIGGSVRNTCLQPLFLIVYKIIDVVLTILA